MPNQALWNATAEEIAQEIVASIPGRKGEVIKNRREATSY